MGFIYKITNLINNKIYIGQTIKTVEKRFNQHKNNYIKPYFSQIVLYKAMKKYGIDNFSCEEIEEVENKQLDEREKYWIKYYNSYYDGYNSTIGGRLVELYDWDVEDIIEKYHQLKSARKVAKIIGCDHNTIDRILNANQVIRYSPAQQQSKPLYFKKKNEYYEFETTTEAAQWLIENNITKMKEIRCVRQEITNRIHNKKTYFGYELNYL